MASHSNIEGVSPEREKRSIDAIVTPSNDEGRNKRNKSKFGFKAIDEVVPKNLMANACEGYMISLRGNIDLFYFEQGQTEAFVNPIVELLVGTKNDMHNWRIHKEQLSKISKIIAVVPRRKNRNEDEPEWKHIPRKLDPNAKFKKHYFVSYDAMNSSKEEKKNACKVCLR